MTEGERLAEWSRALRESTLARLRSVPPGEHGFRMAEGALSFADQAHHLLAADRWLLRKFEQPELGRMVAAAGEAGEPSAEAFGRLLDELESSGRERAETLSRLPDSELRRTLPDERFAGEVTVWWTVVRGNLEHEAHHRGQISAALRALAGGSGGPQGGAG